MFDDVANCARESIPDRQCSIRKSCNQVSACTQREDEDWKYQTKSVTTLYVFGADGCLRFLQQLCAKQYESGACVVMKQFDVEALDKECNKSVCFWC